MGQFISEILDKAIFYAGIGALILAIPTAIYFFGIAAKQESAGEHDFMCIFLSVVCVAILGSLFVKLLF